MWENSQNVGNIGNVGLQWEAITLNKELSGPFSHFLEDGGFRT